MSQLLTISQLAKSFGQEHVLKGIDLNLNAGEIKVLIGKSSATDTIRWSTTKNLHRQKLDVRA